MPPKAKSKSTAADLINKIREEEKCKLDLVEVPVVLAHLLEENNNLKELINEQKEEIEAIKAQNIQLSKDIKDMKKEEFEAIKAKNTQLSNDIKEMKKDNQKMAKDNKDAKEHQYKKAYQNENRSVASHLILKNVAMAEENESKNQTEGIVEELLQDLGVDRNVEVAEVTRFTKSKKATGNKPPVIRVKLSNPGMKAKVFQKVSTLKDSEKFNRISIQNEYPAMIRRQYQAREKEAWGIRKKSKNTTRTRIEVKDGRPVLTVKTAKDQEFRPPKDEEFLQEEEATTSKGEGKKDKLNKAKNSKEVASTSA